MGILIEQQAVIDCLTNTAKYYDMPQADEWTKGIHYGLLHGIDNILDNVKPVEAIPKADYEARLKAEREKIAESVANKMSYMGTCLNERNIILGIITGKRETLDSLCSICKSECCVSNHTALSKSDYENRLKADMVAMLREIQLEIEELDTPNNGSAYIDCVEIIQQKINELETKSEGVKNEK